MKRIKLNDYLILLIITILPFSFYIEKFIPDNLLEMDLFGFEFQLTNVVWYLALKIYLIVILSIWYFTCRNWWKIAILVPLTIEFLKLIRFFNNNNEKFDENDFLTSLPITIPILFILFFISFRLRKILIADKIRNDMSSEIEQVFKELLVDSIIIEESREFLELKRNKASYNKKEYLIKLKNLRNKLINAK